MRNRIVCLLVPAVLGMVLAGCNRAASAGDIGALKPQEAAAIATDAYVYGYPMVTMEMTRRVMTNVAKSDGQHAPMGQFARSRSYPDASFRDINAAGRRGESQNRHADSGSRAGQCDGGR